VKKIMVLRLTVVLLVSTPLAAQQHEHPSASVEKLGTVRFATSCGSAAQPAFTRAIALLHSFEFGRSVESFNAALNADPSCAMAHWGIALSRWGNPFAAGLRPASQMQLGQQAIAAAAAPAAKTERERGYIEAATQLYAEYERRSQSDRVNAYRDAMAGLAAGTPQTKRRRSSTRCRSRSPPTPPTKPTRLSSRLARFSKSSSPSVLTIQGSRTT
jgi:hypothetical protein